MSPRNEREASAGFLAAQIRLLKNATVGFISYKKAVLRKTVLGDWILSLEHYQSNFIILFLLWSDIVFCAN